MQFLWRGCPGAAVIGVIRAYIAGSRVRLGRGANPSHFPAALQRLIKAPNAFLGVSPA